MRNIYILLGICVLNLFMGVNSWAEKMNTGSLDARRNSLNIRDWDQTLSHLIQTKAYLTVVEANVVGNNSFEVSKSFLGGIEGGERLLFSDCDQILIIGSTEEYLHHLITAPVVDLPVKDGVLELSEGKTLESFPGPPAEALFIMLLWRINPPHWGFARQTYGDFFLVTDNKVFGLTENSDGRFWTALLPETSYEDFIKLLEQRIDERK